MRVDTVFLEFTDETPPVLAGGAETLPTVDIALDGDACTYDISGFPAPVATDNCDANPSVRLAGVSRVEDDVLWPVEDLTQLDCGSFQLTWIAEDDCHEQVVNDTVTQIVVIEDVTAPTVVTVLSLIHI